MFSGGLSWWHILIIIAVFILLFGAKKLPDAARGVGRSLRILKSEVSAMHEDDEARKTSGPDGTVPAPPTQIAPVPQQQSAFQQQPVFQAEPQAQPVYRAQPPYQQPAPQPVYQQAPAAQPVYQQAPAAQPVYQQAPAAQPVYQQPVAQPSATPSVSSTYSDGTEPPPPSA